MIRMLRPDWPAFIAQIMASRAYATICGCGASLVNQEMVREHWQRGHFDYQEEGARVPSAWSEFGDGHDYSRTGKHDPLNCRSCLKAAARPCHHCDLTLVECYDARKDGAVACCPDCNHRRRRDDGT
jgi:hypothetical protein